MSNRSYLRELSLVLCLSIAGAADAAPSRGDPEPLLLTEISVTPTGAEFVEIHNPNPTAVDLSDVHITDATFQPGGVYYYNLVTGNLVATGGGGFGDFTARFPAGATIPAGGYQVVALAGSSAYTAAFGTTPDYELFEDNPSADGIPDMEEALPGSINGQGTLNDGREVVVLFEWDGTSDLVDDLDYALWGGTNEAVDKTGVAIDGPDADGMTSSYLPDTATALQDILATGAHPGGDSFQRDDLTEGSEASSGGNGPTGDDETSEDLSATWCIGPATPGAASTCFTFPPLTCSGATTPIHAIQGPGATSPLVGDFVDVEGVVVTDYGAADELGGFFLQTPDGAQDADSSTSEGLFVRTTLLDVELGDLVRVQGQVEESFGVTRIANLNDALICDSGRSVTPFTLVLPLDPALDLETIEGMAISMPQTLTVTRQENLARFGEMTLSNGRLPEPTQVVTPGPDAVAQQQTNALNRMIIDDGRLGTYGQPFVVGQDDATPLNAGNPVRTGATITALEGAMHFTFNTFKIEPSVPLVFDESAFPRTAAPELDEAPLRAAAFNVGNLFSTPDDAGAICGPAMMAACRGADSVSERDRQIDKLLTALLAFDADVVGLSELENNADTSLQLLVDSLNAATAPGTWAYIDAGTIGTDAIKNGLLYTPASVAPVGAPAILDNSVDARFDSLLNRPSLAQTFEHLATGEVLTVTVNHFKSKDCSGATGADIDIGDGQRCFNATRTAAAEALADWLAGDPTTSNDPDHLLLGDFSAYAMEDPIMTLEAEGFVNAGVIHDDPANAWTFEVIGRFGALDHALASASLDLQVLDATHWHINADELTEFDYNTEDLSGVPKPADFYAIDPYRSSDHDPVLVALVPGDGVVDAASDETFLEADRQFAAADGSDGPIVTVQLVNRAGLPVSGVVVELASTGSASFDAPTGVTDASGRFSTALSNTVVETVTISGLYDANGSGTATTPIANGGPRQVTFRDPTEYLFGDGFE